MQADQFRSALKTRPFRSFTLATSSGEEYTVDHPEMVGITESGRTVVLADDRGSVVLDLDSITEYVVAPVRKKKATT
jgi:hypothetical protein